MRSANKRILTYLFSQHGVISLLPILVLTLLIAGIFLAVSQAKKKQDVVTKAQINGDADSGTGCVFMNTAGTAPDATIKSAFCDDFSEGPMPGGRGGDLDERIWSVVRESQWMAISQGAINGYHRTNLNHCKTLMPVFPDDDVHVCNGHFMDGLKDGGGYTFNGFRPRQPFDFTNRTGRIVFDVDAKSVGHAFWPEVWLADEPIPGPYQESPGSEAHPRNGVGINFEKNWPPGQANVSIVYIIKNYQLVQSIVEPNVAPPFTTQDNVRNHFEIRISKNRIEVWASDAGGANFQLRSVVDNVDVPLTHGFVTFQHVQYNAEKAGQNDDQTYHWDNLGFDGPKLPTPRGYDVPDPLTPHKDFPAVNVGWALNPGKIYTCCDWQEVPNFTLTGVDLTGATMARLNFNAAGVVGGVTMRYRFNNASWHDVPIPFLGSNIGRLTAYSVPVPLSDLKSDTNTLVIDMAGTKEIAVSNIDLTIEPGDMLGLLPTSTPCAGVCPTMTPMPTMSMPPSPSASPCTKVGDFNGDCIVDAKDLSFMLSFYRGNDLKADLNKDGKDTIADFSVFASGYGK